MTSTIQGFELGFRESSLLEDFSSFGSYGVSTSGAGFGLGFSGPRHEDEPLKSQVHLYIYSININICTVYVYICISIAACIYMHGSIYVFQPPKYPNVRPLRAPGS